MFVPLAFVGLWVLLRVLPYSERAQLYAGVSSFLEGLQHPVWVAAASGIAVLLLVRRRRARPLEVVSTPVVSNVHVREESGGRLALLMSGPPGAMGRDFIVARRPEEEERIRTRLRELAERSLAFVSRSASAGTSPSATELHREIYSLGLMLSDVLLGEGTEAGDRLFGLQGDHLLLCLTPGLAELPWELIVPRPGAQFLWQQYHVGRQVRDDTSGAPPSAPSRGPLRMLLLADLEAGTPDRSLPAAEAEASELMELAALEPSKLRVVRRSPATIEELRLAFGEGFDVVHFAGHTTDSSGSTGWVLAGGRAADPASILGVAAPAPFLVFANACRSGPIAAVSTWASDAPSRLMSAGVASYVGTLWELEDARACHFSRVFYKTLLQGASLGESMSAARGSQMGVSPFTWANYVLYGDPACRPSSST